MALTRADMVESLFNGLGLSKTDARELVDLFIEELAAPLAAGEQVKLSNFGNFCLRDKNERPGRNPKTGEGIPIPARRVVTFQAGPKLKARVEGYAGTGESAGFNPHDTAKTRKE
jgi:integration host factor subunit alpha